MRNATQRKKTTSKRKATTRRPAANALSLHIGLDSVDPKHYAGWRGELWSCEYDAKDMAGIAEARGAKPTVLLTQQATRTKVLGGLRAGAKTLRSGDFFLLTYSGHGGQVKDVDGDEDDQRDETWCLFDAQLIDDELYLELSKFEKGVRILVLSDSCHSGTVTRAAFVENNAGARAAGRPKWMPRKIAEQTYEAHKAFYDRLQRSAARAGRGSLLDPDAALARIDVGDRVNVAVKDFGPAVILVSGCQDNQTSMDGDRNGAFTGRLREVWNDGAFDGNYPRFHATINAGMPPTQTPNLFTLGETAAFLAERPFQIVAGPRKRVSVQSARAFVEGARIAPARARDGGARRRGAVGEVTKLALDEGKAQAVVVGSEVVSFTTGVTAERREAIVNSALLAQLVATKQVPDRAKIFDWYQAYIDVLANLGWVVQDYGFAEHKVSGTGVEVHKAILQVAAVALGPAPAALAIVTATINALHSMDDSQPWIRIFNRETQEAKAARFQVSVAEQDATGQFFVNLLAFGLEASSKLTQVLFFKVKKEAAKLSHYSGKVSINTTVLDGVSDAVRDKVVAHTTSYVSQLPNL